ncbi:MAG: ABC transporter permease, partial [Bacilli bacterium]|nr:ABC transporter permease [Bacilli bacterium]
GSEKGGEDARWKNAEAYTFSLSEKSYQEVDGSQLRLVHSRRPKLEDISTFALEGVEIENDYSYFLPDLHAFSINGKPMEGAVFRPIGHHDESLLKIGGFPRGGLLANEEAMEKFDGLKLGDEIRFDLPYSLSRFGVKDEGVLSFAFVLTGVVSEFSFLNSARFYYDYGFSQEAMKGEALPAISEAVGEKMNIDSLISSLDGQDAATSYSYHIFAKDKEAALSLERRLGRLEASSLSLDGPVLNSYEAYSSLMKAFLLSLLLFVGIAFLGVFFIVAMASYSSFSKRRKEAAICLALGARKKTIRNVYVKESVLIGLLSSLSALIAYPFVAKGINLYLANRFSLVGLIDVPYGAFLGYPLLLPLALLFFAWLSSYVSTRLALSVLRRLPLAVVLRDE